MISAKFLVRAVFCLGVLPASAFAKTFEVTVGNNFFSPDNLTIELGDTVRWTNASGRTHDVTADDGSWASETSASFTFERTFNSIEEVGYYCTVHSTPNGSSMNGTINVIQASDEEHPQPAFSFSCSVLDCVFTDQSTDSDGTITSWSWEFGDDTTSTSQNPSHSYSSGGAYPVKLTVTDDDGLSEDITQIVTVEDSPSVAFRINSGMSDAWFNPLTDGQGFFVIVWENSNLIFLSWFTFDVERPPQDAVAIFGGPGQRWITALGGYNGDTATLDAYLSTGGVLDSPQPPVVTDQTPVGTITIKWTACNSGTLDYDFPALTLSGSVPIERIVLDNVPACEAGQVAP